MVQSERQEIPYRRHVIYAQVRNGKAMAMVHPEKQRFEGAPGQSLDEVSVTARAWIDERMDALSAHRRGPHIGTTEEYFEAFSFVPLNAGERLMLTAHAAAEGRCMTMDEIAAAGGYRSFSNANALYGGLASKIGGYLALKPKQSETSGEVFQMYHLADDEGARGWRMHEEVAQALTKLNMRGSPR